MRETRPLKQIPVAFVYQTHNTGKHIRVVYDGAGNYTAAVVDARLYAHETVYVREPFTRHARAAAKSAGLKLTLRAGAWLLWTEQEK